MPGSCCNAGAECSPFPLIAFVVQYNHSRNTFLKAPGNIQAVILGAVIYDYQLQFQRGILYCKH